MNHIDTFFKGKTELLDKFKELEQKHNLHIIGKLSKTEDWSNFLSLISELHFGIYFDEKGASLEHEKKINGSKPDWLFVLDSQTIIAEVVRLNPPSADQWKFDFDETLYLALQSISNDCTIAYEYIHHSIPIEPFNISELINLLKQWLNSSPPSGETIQLLDFLMIELLAFSGNYGLPIAIRRGGGAMPDTRRVKSEKSSLKIKMAKYKSIIQENKMPYIVCIYVDPLTWLKPEHIFSAVSSSTINYNGEIPGCIESESEIIDVPLSSLRSIPSISGVLLRLGNDYHYFNNMNASHPITLENIKKISGNDSRL